MKFIIPQDILAKSGKPITWIEAGIYDVVRLFGEGRVLIELGGISKRQIAIVKLDEGTLTNT